MMPIPEPFQLKKEPKQLRSKKLVQKICATTLAVINKKGIRHLNTNLIAIEAGIDVSSIYQFFPNKESILYYIARNWMEEYTAVYERFDSEPELLALPWRDFFSRLLTDWNLPDQSSKLSALQAVWRTYPEFEELEHHQLEFHTLFVLKHFKRYKAKGNQQEWRDIAAYMFYVEDSINEVIADPHLNFSTSLLRLYKESLFSLLEKYLNKY